MRGRYPAWHLRAAVEASLRRLGVERIDLFQLHCWLGSSIAELDWLETLNAPAGATTDTAFIARVPFDSGALIGNWTEDTYARWPPGSVPHTLFRGERFAETLGRVNRLKELCAPHYPTLAEAAIRYSLSPGAVATVIPGMRDPAEVDMNVAYSDGAPFLTELAEQLTEHGWPRNFYK